MKSDNDLMEVRKADLLLPIGNCYWNVNEMIRREGGSMVCGWDIAIWSKSHISAMHHALWLSPAGVLLDVTDTYPSVKNRLISTFLPDDRIVIDLENQPNIPAKHFVFQNGSATLEFVQACQDLHLLDQKIASISYEAGYRCEYQFAMAQNVPITEGFALNLTSASAALYETLAGRRPAAMERIGRAITALNTAL